MLQQSQDGSLQVNEKVLRGLDYVLDEARKRGTKARILCCHCLPDTTVSIQANVMNIQAFEYLTYPAHRSCWC